MRLRKILPILFAFTALTLPLNADDEGKDKWVMISNENGVIIENRPMEGFGMKQLRARCEIDAPVEVIYEVMDDADHYNEWFGDCVLQKTIERINEYEKISYHVVSVPWPLNDRDSLARVTTKADWDKGEVETHVDSIRAPDDSAWGMDPVTKENNRVRMPVMDGIFTYTRIGPNKSQFTYIAIADPGISLPGWLLNAFSTTQPKETLGNLKNQVKKEIYWQMAGTRHNKIFSPDVKE